MAAMQSPMTAEQLLSLHLPGKRTELVRGRLVVSEPPGLLHAELVTWIGSALLHYVRATTRSGEAPGRVFSGDPGFWIARNPDTVRAPDVAYVSASRLSGRAPVGFAEVAPNLAIEVLSPGDRPREVHDKVANWLDAGAELVWVIDPLGQRAWVHRPNGEPAMLDRSTALEGDSVLPGFRLPLGDLFV